MSIEDIQWRGPRPLEMGDPLIGRDRDVDRIATVCRDRDIVVLTAASGVGKTSFLRAGLVPRLQQLGATVLPRWAGLDAADRLASVTTTASWSSVLRRYGELRGRAIDADLLYRLVVCPQFEGAEPPTVHELLDEEACPTPVVLFDQFEELLRYGGALGQALTTMISRTAQDWGVTHIVAARSEYADSLRPLDTGAGNGFRYVLDEIDAPDVIREIVRVPATEAGVDIDEKAVDVVTDLWFAARASQQAPAASITTTWDPGAQVGLLHLQALLWSVRRWALTGAADSERLTRNDLARFVEAHGPDSQGDLVRRALVEYVRATVDQITAGATTRWPNGPRIMLARVARLLFSAGYKVPQSFSSLLAGALSEDLTVTQAERIARLDDDGVAQLGDELRIDPAGAAREWAQTGDVVRESVHVLRTVLDSAADENILRRFPRASETIYELTHDGMGGPLNAWARAVLEELSSIVGLISVRTGERVDGTWTPEVLESEDAPTRAPNVTLEAATDGEPVAVIRGVSWIGNVVSDAQIARIRFVDCDFTGSVFDAVSLDTVTFDRCVLRGVAMVNGCLLKDVTILGGNEPATIDTLTIVDANAVGPVTIQSHRGTTGLFLYGARGGPWAVTDSTISHVVISGSTDGGASLAFTGDTTITHVTLSGTINRDLQLGEGVTFHHVTDDADAGLPDSAAS